MALYQIVREPGSTDVFLIFGFDISASFMEIEDALIEEFSSISIYVSFGDTGNKVELSISQHSAREQNFPKVCREA